MDSKLEKPAAKKRIPPNAGKGRVAGVPNKVTKEFREVVRRLLEENSSKFSRWLDIVANGDGDKVKPDPGKALDIVSRLAEYATPKLTRTELSGGLTITSLSEELAALNKNAE